MATITELRTTDTDAATVSKAVHRRWVQAFTFVALTSGIFYQSLQMPFRYEVPLLDNALAVINSYVSVQASMNPPVTLFERRDREQFSQPVGFKQETVRWDEKIPVPEETWSGDDSDVCHTEGAKYPFP